MKRVSWEGQPKTSILRKELFTQLIAGFPLEQFHRDKKHFSTREFFEVNLVYWDKGR